MAVLMNEVIYVTEMNRILNYGYEIYDSFHLYIYIYIISSIDSFITGTFEPTNEQLPQPVAS